MIGLQFWSGARHPPSLIEESSARQPTSMIYTSSGHTVCRSLGLSSLRRLRARGGDINAMVENTFESFVEEPYRSILRDRSKISYPSSLDGESLT